MVTRLLNLVELVRVVRERGNWQLIRHSRRQLMEFVLCRSGLNSKPLTHVFYYWYDLLKGPDMLIWRLETFGFIFLPEVEQKSKDRLNRYL